MQRPLGVPGFFRVIALTSIDSTSEEAKRLALAGAEEGTLVWAEEQTAGHGRLGRSWLSPPGNLYFSLLLRPDRRAAEAAQLTFVAAVALADAVAQVLPADRQLTCKWPNDVLVGGRKVAGILLESQANRDGGLDCLVVGVGLNVAWHPPDERVLYPATSLRAEGVAADESPRSMLERFCCAFLVRYEAWRELGFAEARAAWLARAEKLHGPVEVRTEAGTVSGVFVGVDDSGAMVLQQDIARRLIIAGDVFPAG